MGTPLESAVMQLEAETRLLETASVGSTAWFTLRAKSTALSMLKAAQARALDDPESFEVYRRQCRNIFVNELGAE